MRVAQNKFNFRTDERLQYLEIAYAAPEKLLLKLNVTVGILGLPRDELDPMLMAKPRSAENKAESRTKLPTFVLPPRIHHRYVCKLKMK